VNVEAFALGILSVMLLASNVFWAKMVAMLTNKIMSRSYYEFRQAEKLKDPPVRTESKEDDYMVDPEDERQAKELNAILNIV
jgi:hypothetical protein